ncbi:cyclin, N-terminal domain-containing protein [Cryptosporidium serpentis]
MNRNPKRKTSQHEIHAIYSNNKSIGALSDCLFLGDQGYKRQPINLSKFEYNHIFASIMGKEYNSNEIKQNENFENLKIESLNRDSENWVTSQSQIESIEVPSNTSTQSNISNSIQTQQPINIVESGLNKKLETFNKNSSEFEKIEINEFEKCSYFEDEILQLKNEYLYNNNIPVEIVWERLKTQEKQYYTLEVYNFYISKCKICISPCKISSNEWINNQKVPLVFIRKNILDELSNLIWLQRMRNEILFTSIYYFDNTLCKDNFFWNITAIEKIRELAYSCVYLAAKVEEVVHISHKELCKRSSIPSKTILNLERHILKVLTFKLNPPIPITFLQLLLEMYKAKKVQNFGNNSKKILEYYICSYILEICLYDIELMQYSPLEQALAAIYIARQCIEFNCNKEKNYIISLYLDQVEIKGNTISNFKYDYNLKNQYKIVKSIIRIFQYSHIINTITTKKYQSKEYMGAANYVLKALSLNNNNNTISISSNNKKKIGNN